MDDKFYRLKDCIKINGIYRMFVVINNNEEYSDILILIKDNKIYDVKTKKQWTDNDIETIRLQMNVFNEQEKNSCGLKLIKKI